MELAKYFFPYFKPYLKRVFLAILLALPLAGIKGATVWLTKNLVNEVLIKRDLSTLKLIPIAMVGLYLVNLVLRFFHYYLIRSSADRVVVQIREDVLKKLTSLHVQYFQEHPAGDLISRSLADVVYLGMGINLIGSFIREPIIFLSLLGYAIYLNWKLTLFCLVVLPLFAWVFNSTGKRVRRYGAKLQAALGGSTRIVHEAIGGARVIKSYSLGPFVLKRYQHAQSEWIVNQLKWGRLEEFARPLIELIGSIAIALIILFGGYQVIKGEATPGDLLGFLTAMGLLQDPIRKLNDSNLQLSQALAAGHRVAELLKVKDEIPDAPDAIELPSFKNSIHFDHLSFSYHQGEEERLVLKEISLEIKKGETVAFVGPSGGGKSTLVSLVPRLYDVTKGTIKIDGIDIRSVTQESLRNNIALVSQDSFLFNDSVKMNVLCGRLDATDEEVERALKLANAWEFVQKLPQQLETRLGDQGMKLSGGQRQRISIARAILRDAPILILDEATSALDNESEKAVQEALTNLMKGRTTLVIAHRLSTVENANRIVVLVDGKIVEIGTHEELIKSRGEYHNLATLGGLA